MAGNVYLYSIGYGHKTLEKLLEELSSFGVKTLIDVRSVPYSKWNEVFRKKYLERELPDRGFEYLWLGNLLGGMPDCPACYENGKLNYEKVYSQAFFKEGIRKLLRFQEAKKKAAIMCAEENPKHCHRSKLIGKYLYEREGISLYHILGKGLGMFQEELFRGLF